MRKPLGLKSYGMAIAISAVATGVCCLMYKSFDQANLIMVYLFGVAYVALTYGIREAVLASVLSVVAFDLVCTEPRGSITASDVQYVVTLAIMLSVAVLINGLVVRLRTEVIATAEKERRTAALYRLGKELSRHHEQKPLAFAARQELASCFAADVAILLPGPQDWEVVTGTSYDGFVAVQPEAKQAFERGEVITQRGNRQAPDSLFVPMKGAGGSVGVLVFRPAAGEAAPETSFLETFAGSVGIAIERARLEKTSREATLQAEGQKVRNALLSSISHDLRTPLAAITCAAGAFAEGKGDGRELAATIYDESIRLNLQIRNLLDMTRLQSGEIALRREWNSFEELVGIALRWMGKRLEGRQVEVNIPPDLPLVSLDGDLIAKVLLNLLENAVVHTPQGTEVEIRAGLSDQRFWFSVADRGVGIPDGQASLVFEPFVQIGEHRSSGFGLGLGICQAVAHLHGGVIQARKRIDGPGSEFRVELPMPDVVAEVPYV